MIFDAEYQAINLLKIAFLGLFEANAGNHLRNRKVSKNAEGISAETVGGKSPCFFAGKNNRVLVSFRTVWIFNFKSLTFFLW